MCTTRPRSWCPAITAAPISAAWCCDGLAQGLASARLARRARPAGDRLQHRSSRHTRTRTAKEARGARRSRIHRRGGLAFPQRPRAAIQAATRALGYRYAYDAEQKEYAHRSRRGGRVARRTRGANAPGCSVPACSLHASLRAWRETRKRVSARSAHARCNAGLRAELAAVLPLRPAQRPVLVRGHECRALRRARWPCSVSAALRDRGRAYADASEQPAMSAFGLPEQASSIAPRVDHAVLRSDAGHEALVGARRADRDGLRSASAIAKAPRRRRADDIPAAQARARRRIEVAWIGHPAAAVHRARSRGRSRSTSSARRRPPMRSRSSSSPSSGCGSSSMPAGSARSTSCTCRVGQPVKLVMTSQDVIHSFFVPAFRVKQDVLPGRYTRCCGSPPTRAGRYHLFCAEYCGTDHSRMRRRRRRDGAGRLSQRWLAGHRERRRHGRTRARRCSASSAAAAATARTRPCTRRDLARPVRQAGAARDGSDVIADERYLRDSILLPRKRGRRRLRADHAVVRGPDRARTTSSSSSPTSRASRSRSAAMTYRATVSARDDRRCRCPCTADRAISTAA